MWRNTWPHRHSSAFFSSLLHNRLAILLGWNKHVSRDPDLLFGLDMNAHLNLHVLWWIDQITLGCAFFERGLIVNASDAHYHASVNTLIDRNNACITCSNDWVWQHSLFIKTIVSDTVISHFVSKFLHSLVIYEYSEILGSSHECLTFSGFLLLGESQLFLYSNNNTVIQNIFKDIV